MDINIIITCRKMMTETIAVIRFPMDRIEEKGNLDIFGDWDKEEEVKTEE